MNQWAEQLDEYLAGAKISKKQLAENMGISINTMGKWWRDREPSAEHAAKVRQLLADSGVSAVRATLPAAAAVAPVAVIEEKKAPVKEYTEDAADRGERYKAGAVIISLSRTTCPFCGKALGKFQNCAACGQHFVWAQVPLGTSPK